MPSKYGHDPVKDAAYREAVRQRKLKMKELQSKVEAMTYEEVVASNDDLLIQAYTIFLKKTANRRFGAIERLMRIRKEIEARERTIFEVARRAKGQPALPEK